MTPLGHCGQEAFLFVSLARLWQWLAGDDIEAQVETSERQQPPLNQDFRFIPHNFLTVPRLQWSHLEGSDSRR